LENGLEFLENFLHGRKTTAESLPFPIHFILETIESVNGHLVCQRSSKNSNLYDFELWRLVLLARPIFRLLVYPFTTEKLPSSSHSVAQAKDALEVSTSSSVKPTTFRESLLIRDNERGKREGKNRIWREYSKQERMLLSSRKLFVNILLLC